MTTKAFGIMLNDKVVRAYAKQGHAKVSCDKGLGEVVIPCRIVYCKPKKSQKPQHWWSH